MSCSSKPKKIITEEYESLSIIELIAQKEKFRNQKVRVKGILRLEFEGDSIYLDKESYSNRINKNSLYLLLSPELRDKAVIIKKDLEGKYVDLKGTLTLDTGMWGLFSGTIQVESINDYPKEINEEDIDRIFNLNEKKTD